MPVPLWNDEAYDVGGLPTGSATVLDDGQVRIVYPGGCNCNFPSCKWSCQVSPGSGSGPNGEHGGGTYAVAEPENTSDPLMTRWRKPSYNPVFPSSTERNDANQIFADSSSAWKTAHGEWRFVGVNPNYTVAAPLKPPAGCENAPGCNMSPLFGSTDGFQSFKLIGYQENFTAGECPSLFPVRALNCLTVSFFVHSRPMCQSSLHHASSLTSSPSARLAAWRIMSMSSYRMSMLLCTYSCLGQFQGQRPHHQGRQSPTLSTRQVQPQERTTATISSRLESTLTASPESWVASSHSALRH